MWTGYQDGGDLAEKWYVLVWFLHWGEGIKPQVGRLACGKAYTAGQWASGKKLADLKLADLPIEGLLCPL